jgi:Xaa-Pro dipeptidase
MSVRETRAAALFERLPAGVDAIALTPGPSLRYLTGYQFGRTAWGEASPFLFVLTRDLDAATLLPELEVKRAGDALPGEFFMYADDGDDPATAADALASAVDLTPPVGAEFTTMRLQELALLALSPDDLVDVSDPVAELRARKDKAELGLYREAARITDEILGAAIETIEPGVRERDVERELVARVLESDADGYGSGVVTSGPRTAVNYTETTDRRIEEGDLVLIDTGVVYEGYYTDVTRTVAVGDPPEPLVEVHDVVRRAARVAREAAEPGMTAHELDRVAREMIEDAGYGDEFVTGLGHGIGLDSHEPPVLDREIETVLEAGHVFTVEPGIYLEGVGGVRIEDDVALRADGAEVLTSLERSIEYEQ